MRSPIRAAVLVAVLLLAPAAGAHVTVNPNEASAGSFSRFDVRVPTERDDAGTVSVTLQLPEGATNVSFQPKPGWERSVEMETLDEPIEVFGEEVTERIASVTWSGGEIAPGEFDEFGVSLRVPDEAAGQELVFPAVQEYSSGEVVRWIGEADSDAPAPRVAVGPAEEEGGASSAASSASGGSGDGGRDTLTLVLAIAGLAAALVALGLALARRRHVSADQEPVTLS